MDAQGLLGVFHSLAHSVQRCGSRMKSESYKLAGHRKKAFDKKAREAKRLSLPNCRNHKNRSGQLDVSCWHCCCFSL